MFSAKRPRQQTDQSPRSAHRVPNWAIPSLIGRDVDPKRKAAYARIVPPSRRSGRRLDGGGILLAAGTSLELDLRYPRNFSVSLAAPRNPISVAVPGPALVVVPPRPSPSLLPPCNCCPTAIPSRRTTCPPPSLLLHDPACFETASRQRPTAWIASKRYSFTRRWVDTHCFRQFYLKVKPDTARYFLRPSSFFHQ